MGAGEPGLRAGGGGLCRRGSVLEIVGGEAGFAEIVAQIVGAGGEGGFEDVNGLGGLATMGLGNAEGLRKQGAERLRSQWVAALFERLGGEPVGASGKGVKQGRIAEGLAVEGLAQA